MNNDPKQSTHVGTQPDEPTSPPSNPILDESPEAQGMTGLLDDADSLTRLDLLSTADRLHLDDSGFLIDNDGNVTDLPADPVYGKTSVTTVLARAWILLKRCWLPTAKVMVFPVLLFNVHGIINASLSSHNALQHIDAQHLLTLVGLVALFIVSFALFMASLIAAVCMLSTIYYSAIVLKAPVSLGRAVKRLFFRSPVLITLSVIAFVAVIIFGLINALTVVVGIAVFSSVLLLFKQGFNILLIALLSIFLVLWGSVVVGSLITGVGLQLMSVLVPFISVMTHRRKQAWKASYQCFSVALANPADTFLLAAGMVVVIATLSALINLPVSMWALFEVQWQGISEHLSSIFPRHVAILLNMWSSVGFAILLPFTVSILTLFYYNCKVKKEAVDLKLRLLQAATKS